MGEESFHRELFRYMIRVRKGRPFKPLSAEVEKPHKDGVSDG